MMRTLTRWCGSRTLIRRIFSALRELLRSAAYPSRCCRLIDPLDRRKRHPHRTRTSQVQRGEFLMLFGPSGGGKTSLLNLIGTVDQPTKGSARTTSDIAHCSSSVQYLHERWGTGDNRSISLAGARLTARTPDKRLAQVREARHGPMFACGRCLQWCRRHG